MFNYRTISCLIFSCSSFCSIAICMHEHTAPTYEQRQSDPELETMIEFALSITFKPQTKESRDCSLWERSERERGVCSSAVPVELNSESSFSKEKRKRKHLVAQAKILCTEKQCVGSWESLTCCSIIHHSQWQKVTPHNSLVITLPFLAWMKNVNTPASPEKWKTRGLNTWRWRPNEATTVTFCEHNLQWTEQICPVEFLNPETPTYPTKGKRYFHKFHVTPRLNRSASNETPRFITPPLKKYAVDILHWDIEFLKLSNYSLGF